MLAASLLRVCRTLHDEVKSFLYANNGIVVLCDHVDYGLGTIRRMTPEQCRSLRHLYVQLYDEESRPDCPPTPQLISTWRETARHILSHTDPKMLTLHLMCDTGDSKETRAVLEPLLATPATLKSCVLRLSSRHQYHLRSLAEKFAARIDGRTTIPSNYGFRFLDLPPELRAKILDYTDLVTPYNQIEWESVRGFRVRLPTSNCYMADGYGDLHQDTDFLHDSANPLYKGLGNLLDGPLHQSLRFFRCQPVSLWEAGSFCCRRRSSASLSCRCWIPPRPLMLVCRAMYEDAIRILYTRNRIIILPKDCIFNLPISIDSTLRRLEASKFITRHTKPHVLQHLRTLEVVFPQIHIFYFDTSNPFYLDWQFAVHHLREHANLSVLTVILHMSSNNPTPRRWHDYVDKELKDMVRSHVQLLTPLRSLGGMKRLFIYLESLWYWGSYKKMFWIDWDGEGRLCQRPPTDPWQLEVWLERVVMGRKYNSWVLGKRAQGQPSEWVKSEVRSQYMSRNPREFIT